MRILVVGSYGQLGQELMRARWPDGVDVAGSDRDTVDISVDGAAEAIVMETSADIVINCAAYTAVDKAETDAAAAYAANSEAPRLLARACQRRHIPIIHISTDYVFDGTKQSPYVEDDPVAPLGVYGISKWEGEQAVRHACKRHLILRTAWLYSAFGQNFVKTMLRLAAERPEVRVVVDQTGSPTSAADLAAVISSLVAPAVSGRATYGTYHAANGGAATWYDFASAILTDYRHRTGRSVNVIPIPTSSYPTPARRPGNSRLDCGRLQRNFGVIFRPWQEALVDVLNEIYKQSGQ
jgi:dTDP-4-dehydrorhamnose reductase